jgi:rRNA maturation endonuclease Nob1
MGYTPDKGEVFFCGSCRRQQEANDNVKCKSCGSTTVSWYTNRESEADAISKWKRVNGK